MINSGIESGGYGGKYFKGEMITMRSKKVISALLVLALCVGLLHQLPAIYTGTVEVDAAVAAVTNIGVDINNGTDKRETTRSTIFYDWSIESGGEEDPSFTVDGITFTLKGSNGKGDAKLIMGDDNRNLVRTDGNTPVLTLDGARLRNTFSDGIMTLEISGLAAGEHSITTWHNYFYNNPKDEPMSVSINGEVVQENVNVTLNNVSTEVYDDLSARILYHTFTVKEGETVVIVFSSEKGVPVLNAFELDGVDPLHSIKNPLPADGELHFEPENGLSWTAADGAVSHRLFIGTDYQTVARGLDDDYECAGRLTGTSYDLTQSKWWPLDHMKTYYWRVDEIYSDGSIVNGKVMSFEVVHLAFPSAEGYGRFAKAGRGGRIVEVTTLEDGYQKDEEGNDTELPIEGSLRWALEYEKGARIVIFKVGGVIALQKQLCIPSDGGNVYVAGQTAPGDGITLINYDFGAMGSSDVVIRDMRVRVGDMNDKATGGMGVAGCDHTIIDHCSISWATDEGFSSRNAYNITFQWNIIGETLNNSVHYNAQDRDKTEPHSFAASIGGDKGSFHHNLLIDNTGRNWSMAGGVGIDNKSYGGQLDIRNNVVYNFRNRTTDGGARRVNFVGNYYKMGEVSQQINIFTLDGNELSNPNDHQMAYLSGNKYVNKYGATLLDPETDDPWKYAVAAIKPGSGAAAVTPEDCISYEPFFESFVKTDSVDEAYDKVVADAGANVPKWDYIDSRYIKEVTESTWTFIGSKDGLKGIIDSQNDVGGYPNETNFKGGEAPVDTDGDGCPDAWEIEHGLNPNDWYDGMSISLSGEGYTNLELYLNELAGDEVKYLDKPVVVWRPDPTPGPDPTPAPLVDLGDVDGNGVIDANDALLVLKAAAQLEDLSEEAKAAADVTFDGVVDANDALEILKLAAQLRGPFVKPE